MPQCKHGVYSEEQRCDTCSEIAEAVAEERERCARVAEDFKNIGGNVVSRQYCDSIAECIRRG